MNRKYESNHMEDSHTLVNIYSQNRINNTSVKKDIRGKKELETGSIIQVDKDK